MTLDLFNTKKHEQMRCGFFHRDNPSIGFIGVESTMNPKLHGFYNFTNLEQIKELRMFLEEVEKEWKRREEKELEPQSGLTESPEMLWDINRPNRIKGTI